MALHEVIKSVDSEMTIAVNDQDGSLVIRSRPSNKAATLIVNREYVEMIAEMLLDWREGDVLVERNDVRVWEATDDIA